MGHHSLQIELERCPDSRHRQALLDRLEHCEVVSHHEVGFPGEQELHAIDLRPAHLDRRIEPSPFIEPGRLGLIEPAVLGLCKPAREKGDFVGRGSRRDQESAHPNRCRDGP